MKALAVVVVTVLSLLGCAESALDETCTETCDDGENREATLPERVDEIRAYYEGGDHGTLNGAWLVDPIDLSYVVFRAENPIGAIVFVQGRADSNVKYAELAYDLRDSGFSLYMLDHRGQGLSSRLVDDRLKGHVENYGLYNQDLGTFIDEVVVPDGHERVFGLSHSMGGAILAQYAADNPDVFDALVMAAPMFGIQWRIFGFDIGTEGATRAISALLGEEKYAKPYTDFTKGYDGNEFTDSRNRYEFAINTIEEWYPKTAVRGPTNGWIVQSVDAMRAVRPEAPGMQTPMRILQAMDDKIVDLEEQDNFCDAAPNCEMIRFGGFTRIEDGEEREFAAKHELFTAPDQIRTGAIVSAMNFFARHL